jgi:hypothetical protein
MRRTFLSAMANMRYRQLSNGKYALQATQQWQICATGNQWAGVCKQCDIDLNWLVIEFMRLPEAMATAYERGE